MYVAHSGSPEAVSLLRKMEIYRRVLWSLVLSGFLTTLVISRLRMIPDSPYTIWMTIAGGIQLVFMIGLIVRMLAGGRVVKSYMESGEIVDADPL